MKKQLYRLIGPLVALLIALSGCGSFQASVQAEPTPSVAASQISEADLEATLTARLEATQQAQQKPAPSATILVNTEPTEVAPSPTETAPPNTATPQQDRANATTQPASTVVVSEVEPTVATEGTASTTTAVTEGGGDTTAPATTFQPVATASQLTVNIELVFDASGSMAQTIPGSGETRIAAARRAMERVIDQLPDNNPNFNVGFRVYGHKGDNTEAGKAESCQATELLVPVQSVDKALLRQQANAWEPTGWTPISLGLQKAGEDLKAGENVRNVIIMVTDGEETCAGDPCAVAKALNESGSEVRIDVVGFGQDPTLKDKLSCVPESTGGKFIDAENGDVLTQALEELILVTAQRSYLQIIALDETGKPGERLKLNTVVDAQGQRAEILNAPPNDQLTDGKALLELTPGTYQFSVNPNYLQVGFEGFHITYTATIEQGQTTVATVGVGSMTLVRTGVDKRYLCDSIFEQEQNGVWVKYNLPGLVINCQESFIFDELYLLPPGVYRIRDIKREQVIVERIVIAPGKAVTLRFSE